MSNLNQLVQDIVAALDAIDSLKGLADELYANADVQAAIAAHGAASLDAGQGVVLVALGGYQPLSDPTEFLHVAGHVS